MVSTKVKLRTSAIDGCEGVLVIQLISNRRVKIIKTVFKLFPHEWDGKNEQVCYNFTVAKARLQYLRELQSELNAEMLRMKDIIRALEKKDIHAVDEIAHCFAHHTVSANLFQFMEQLSFRMQLAGQSKSASMVDTARRSFTSFLQESDIRLSLISAPLVKQYESFLLRKNLALNTVSCYMRILRSVYNKAVEEGLSPQRVPFCVDVVDGLHPHAESCCEEKAAVSGMRAQSIPYIDENGASLTTTGTVNTITSGTTELGDGWYYVSGTVTVGDRIIVNATTGAHLILEDGCDFTVTGGIQVQGSKLTIYGQSGGSSKLTADATAYYYRYNAGIGGSYGFGGTININGGTVTATGGTKSVGIGGGKEGNSGSITIIGGTVKAIRGNNAPNNIGHGDNNSGSAGYVVIAGGSVHAGSINPLPRRAINATYVFNTLTLSGVATVTPLTAGSINGRPCDDTPSTANRVYGIKDVQTDAAGKVYFYLSASGNSGADGETIRLADGSNYYQETFARQVNSTTAETLNKEVTAADILGVTPPVAGALPVAAITETAEYTGTVSWSPADNPFGYATAYTATITLAPKTGYTLAGVAADFFTVTGATTVANSAGSGVVTAVFPATAALVSIAAILGVTPPVAGATPVDEITETAQYTGAVAWSPADNPFGYATSYTATITLAPKTGYTLAGVAADFFIVTGATATNSVGSGVVTAVFPATAPPPTYGISVGSFTGGSVSANRTLAAAGETVMLTVYPASGYELSTISVFKTSDASVSVSVNGFNGLNGLNGLNGSFTMPDYGVTVSASFSEIPPPEPDPDAVALDGFIYTIRDLHVIVPQEEANAESDVAYWLRDSLAHLFEDRGWEATVQKLTVVNFFPATAGTRTDMPGANGSFSFFAILRKGYVTDRTYNMDGTVMATRYIIPHRQRKYGSPHEYLLPQPYIIYM
ncbi:hypothetical protein FACS1894181_11300 [Bacteroidia bacterium]|nr:hypothetical protein FACS1894181_11300 [Bacteroidia bacterium]